MLYEICSLHYALPVCLRSGSCVHSCTKIVPSFLIRHHGHSVKIVKKRRRLLLVTTRLYREKMHYLNISTFMYFFTFVCVFIQYENILILASTCIHPPDPCRLRALTIHAFVLILCTAVADNKASFGNMEGQAEG